MVFLREKVSLAGEKFGRLTVISEDHKNKHIYWKCVCDCGGEKVVRGDALLLGKTRSCGCLIHDVNKAKIGTKYGPQKPIGNVPRKAVFGSYKYSAKKRGLGFELTQEQFEFLAAQNCFYCGSPPSTVEAKKEYYGIYIYNGIDRIDNSKGYFLGNVVSCCSRCNKAKFQSSQKEFFDWAMKLYFHLVSKGFIEV